MSKNKVRLEKLEQVMGYKGKKSYVVLPEILIKDNEEVICFQNKQRTTLTRKEFEKVPKEEIEDILEIEIEFV